MFSGSDYQMLQYPPPSMEMKWKSNVELAPSCPRCASPNTKFCYYNNYSLSQPRYFCKGCRRYWTKGGSLRNVPVGGGCRKNRRAKSARRVSENERVPVKSFSSSDDNRNEQQTGNDEGESSTVGQNGGSDIDLAVVFAKFLNESSSSQPQEITNNAFSNSSTPETGQNDGILIQNPSNHIIEDANLLEEFPQVFDIGEKQDFLENDMNGYGLQTLLRDETVQDALWTDAAAGTLPNFNWQPMFQLQNFDSFLGDGQLKASANVMTDQWSSFDLSGFEVYSRP